MNKLFKQHKHQSSKTYEGLRFDDGSKRGRTLVTVNSNPLYSTQLESEDEMYTGVYEWGYRGGRQNINSKPTNLAQSILADYLETTDFPEELMVLFKKQFISVFPFESWKLESQTIEDWLAYIHKLTLDKESYEKNNDYFGSHIDTVSIA